MRIIVFTLKFARDFPIRTVGVTEKKGYGMIYQTKKLTLLLGFVSMMFSCGSGGTPQKPVSGSPGAAGFADANGYGGFADTPCTATQCPKVQLSVSTSTGGSSLTAYVNQQANWSIQATSNPPTNRRLIIIAEGGPDQCQWSNLRSQDTTACQFQPTSAESATTPIQVKMLDVSYCEFAMRQRGQNPNCEDIDAILNSGADLGASTGQVSWTIVDSPGGSFDPNAFTLPEVKDRSAQVCMMSALGPALGGILGGNFIAGMAGGINGCMTGFMNEKNNVEQRQMMQQQIQYQQQFGATNSPYGQYSGQQPFYGLTGDNESDNDD